MEIQWAFGLAAFAGFIRYIQRFAAKKEDRSPWEWTVASVAVLTGGFVGALTLWLLDGVSFFGKKIDGGALLFGIAIAGYGGPLTLDFFWDLCKDLVKRTAERAANVDAKN